MKKPKPEKEWALHRCILNCKVGRDAFLDTSELPSGQKRTDFAIYNVLKAIEELALAMAFTESSRIPHRPRRSRSL